MMIMAANKQKEWLERKNGPEIGAEIVRVRYTRSWTKKKRTHTHTHTHTATEYVLARNAAAAAAALQGFLQSLG
jgi:hypothetical protein